MLAAAMVKTRKRIQNQDKRPVGSRDLKVTTPVPGEHSNVI